MAASLMFRNRNQLLLPPLDIHARGEKPDRQRTFAEHAGDHVVGKQKVSERLPDKSEPADACEQHPDAENARQKIRSDDQEANRQTIESEENQAETVGLRADPEKYSRDGLQLRDRESSRR